jgi:hypothetical protein
MPTGQKKQLVGSAILPRPSNPGPYHSFDKAKAHDALLGPREDHLCGELMTYAAGELRAHHVPIQTRGDDAPTSSALATRTTSWQ